MQLSEIQPFMMCYLAGPYTAPTKEQTESRMEQLCRADANLMARGIKTVTPLSKHFVIKYRDLPGDWKYWQDYSTVLLMRCDVLLVLCMEGWEDSVGVQGEIAVAGTKDLPVIYLNADGSERL